MKAPNSLPPKSQFYSNPISSNINQKAHPQFQVGKNNNNNNNTKTNFSKESNGAGRPLTPIPAQYQQQNNTRNKALVSNVLSPDVAKKLQSITALMSTPVSPPSNANLLSMVSSLAAAKSAPAPLMKRPVATNHYSNSSLMTPASPQSSGGFEPPLRASSIPPPPDSPSGGGGESNTVTKLIPLERSVAEHSPEENTLVIEEPVTQTGASDALGDYQAVFRAGAMRASGSFSTTASGGQPGFKNTAIGLMDDDLINEAITS